MWRIDNGNHDHFHHTLVVVSLTLWGIENWNVVATAEIGRLRPS